MIYIKNEFSLGCFAVQKCLASLVLILILSLCHSVVVLLFTKIIICPFFLHLCRNAANTYWIWIEQGYIKHTLFTHTCSLI